MKLKQWIRKNLEEPFYTIEILRAEMWSEENKKEVKHNNVKNKKQPAFR